MPLESPWAGSSGQRGGTDTQPQSWSSIQPALGSSGPGTGASWGKVNTVDCVLGLSSAHFALDYAQNQAVKGLLFPSTSA